MTSIPRVHIIYLGVFGGLNRGYGDLLVKFSFFGAKQINSTNRFAVILLASLLLNGCAMFERDSEEPDNSPPFPPSNIEASTFLSPEEREATANMSETKPEAKRLAASPAENRPGSAAEQEIAQLNSKVEALETKIEVMREEMRRLQIRGVQPQLKAEAPVVKPTPTLPQTIVRDQTNTASAAQTKSPVKMPTVKANPTLVERNFRDAMKLLRDGDNRESANLFYSLAKSNPDHALASHALFWAGEAGARARNWKVSIRHWTKVEREYPRSNYMPEILAGLSRAHAATGNLSMSKKYREALVKAFPDAPATLNFMSGSPNGLKE